MMDEKQILLVEDNRDDEELAVRALRKHNIANKITVARDGAEAVDLLLGSGASAGADTRLRPQVVLLDLNLPRLSGLEVLKRLRADERTRMLPVVVLTSSKEDEDILNSYSLGANAYVRKPVEFGSFVEAVKALGLFWVVVNESPPQKRAPS
jgi:two-component system response regulator